VNPETFRVSSSGQMSLAAPAGHAAQLLDDILPADDHYRTVAADDDPDLATT